MASKVEIANFALQIIGEESITSFTEDSKQARAINLRYDNTRDAVLRAHPWNFAVRRAQPAQMSATPTFEFDNAYTLPTDFLRVLGVNEHTSRDRYQVEFHDGKRALLTDASSLDLKYIARITDTGNYDPLFIEALAARLAWVLAIPIANDESIRDRAKDLYTFAIGEARSIDGQENPPVTLFFDDFIDARKSGADFRPIEDV